MKWTHQVPRDRLTVTTRNTLGAILTLFKLGGDVAKELQANQVPLGAPVAEAPPARPQELAAEEEVARDVVLNDLVERADQFIEDAISKLGWQEMQRLVAGILRAIGYRTSVSEAGPDRGVDIFASPDGLGLEEPRIFVAPRADEGGRRPGRWYP